MYKILSLFIVPFIFLFAGCSLHEQVSAKNVKSFEDEDRLIMFALYAKTQGDANSTINLFELLYEESGKTEYRDEVIIMMLQSRQSQRALVKVAYYKKDIDKLDVRFKRLEIAVLIQLKRYEEAKNLSLILVEETKEAQDYQQVASLYMIEGRYDFSLRYLQSAYAINYDEKILDKMAIVLYVNLNKKSEAISNLETHILLNGCSETICLRLASFYSEENDIEGMLRVYQRLYDNTLSLKYAQSIVKLLTYKKDAIALVQFLEKSEVDDVLLLQMYVNIKNYEKVVSLGSKLYEKEGDPYYLGQSAIFEYEGAKDKNDKLVIDSVMQKLIKVVSESDEAVYLNYLGYLLIDHELDIKKGMNYVKRALKEDSNSAYYLDSLAWGYYKQGYCSKALTLMKGVTKQLDKEDAEVSSHIKAMKKCIKKGKR
ncbi:hypothetical protein JHD50_07585 [Sulfurimonas sp. MAG313]|nr:hypothetical protein [Sulfurimonas sp. MAG313]MDF1881163.1 hypothetical protein [Sulfurimonas sp. MAG313]